MADTQKAHIYVVDDDSCIRDAVVLMLEKAGFNVTSFEAAAPAIKALKSPQCDLMVTDIRMPEIDGIQLLTEAKRLAPWLPVLMMTSYGDVPLAVKAVKAGAFDFIEKPLDRIGFLKSIDIALAERMLPDHLKQNPLTRTEMIVLRHIMESKSNREIARTLHRSVRTIEVHRHNIMTKIGAQNVVDLVKKVSSMGLANPNTES